MSFRFKIEEWQARLEQALTKTYAFRESFESESDFKFELFHNLHSLKLDGYKLGSKLPGYPTCLLHAEAKPVNGNPSKADLLVCNPIKSKPMFNYRTEVIIELKKTLSATEFGKEVDKLIGYGACGIRKVYVIPANTNSLSQAKRSAILADRALAANKVVIYDRDFIRRTSSPRQSIRRPSRVRDDRLMDPTIDCITRALRLYGASRNQYHGFFWCNYEHEQNKGWTFPSEGDFNAQLYHLLRMKLPNETNIRTEFRLRSGRCDFFISSPRSESVAIEVKMNWDQLRLQPNRKKQEIDSLLDKFAEMERDRIGHYNILVVIQGQHGQKSNNRSIALSGLSASTVAFELLQYNEDLRQVTSGRLGS